MMNLEQCEIKQLSDENVRNCKEIDRLKQENAELMAHVDNLMKHLEYTTTVEMCADETGYIEDEGFVNRKLIFERAAEVLMTTPAQSLQQIKRDAVLEALDYCKRKGATFGSSIYLWDLKEYANNLVKGGE